jgi:tRNA pseudouridine13 synthase
MDAADTGICGVLARIPFLTAEIPGTGGEIRTRPEDFAVEEIPLYPASGSGTHLYLTVKKRGLTTHEVIDALAKSLGKKRSDIGYAGLKDARAVAIQRFSVEHVSEETARALSIHGVEILKIERHRNKIKPGHLAGNRFTIVIRGARSGSLNDAQRVMDVLARRGVPNHFGGQRFGRYGTNHAAGKALIIGNAEAFLNAVVLPPQWQEIEKEAFPARCAFAEKRYSDALNALPPYLKFERRLLEGLVKTGNPEKALRALPPHLALFYMNSYQSHLFNTLLLRRGIDNIDRLLQGDLAYIHKKGAVFAVKDAAVEQSRADAGEISPSGPLYGWKTPLASGTPGEMEQALLAEEGLSKALFDEKRLGRLTGERRPFRVPIKVDGPVEEREPGTLTLTFSLPAGAYATNVIREIIKTPASYTDE